MKIRPTAGRWVCVAAGILIGAMNAGAQSPPPNDYAKDPLQLLRDCQAAQEKTSGFTAVFTKHERINNYLREPETMFMKCRYAPLSFYFKWTKHPNKDREVIYAEGKYDNLVIGHQPPIPLEIKKELNSGDLMKENLYPVTQAGIRSVTKMLVDVAVKAKAAGDLQMFCIESTSFNGRPCWLVIRVLPQKAAYPAFLCWTHVDKELMAPVRVVSFDWNDNLISSYTYSDVKLNALLADSDFDRENRDYRWPGLLFLGKLLATDGKKRK